jgi:hypothetical protein
LLATVVAMLIPAAAVGASQITDEAPMLVPVDDDWSVHPSFTVGEYVGDYLPVGILDGIGAYASRGNGVVRVFVNHELNGTVGHAYELANSTSLTGARVSWFDIQAQNLKVLDSGLAFDTIYDIHGDMVTDAAQLDGGLRRFCSGRGVQAGELGFVDAIHLAGEETFDGYLYALDTEGEELWAVPAAGAMAWENVTPVESGDPNTVALLVGDDRVAAPLWLYVGEKDAIGDGSFLDRNGLAVGTLSYWVSDAGYMDPRGFNGTGNSTTGSWVAVDSSVDVTDAQALLDHAYAGGAFQFSRPEDVHDNPEDSTQVVMASTGRDTAFDGADSWGTTYLIDVDTGDIKILYDGDDSGNGQFTAPQYGLRSPDNLTWASDGMIYVQEDRAVSSALRPTWAEGGEAKLWSLDPATGEANLVAQVDRSAVPDGQTDVDPNDVGDWETSGVLDVTDLFHTKKGEVLLIADVQAHSLRGGIIDSEGLVEGGQLLFLSTAR